MNVEGDDTGDETLEIEVGGDESGEVEETVISFADEGDGETEDTPLVKQLRQQLRERDRKLAEVRRTGGAPANDADPEPAIPAIPKVENFDYDADKFDAAVVARDQAVAEHAEWKMRQGDREKQRRRAQEEQQRQIEQQRAALGVGDYDAHAGKVQERLNEQQLAVLISAADNPARLIYALGRSEGKLDTLAAEGNLAKFAAMIGRMERDIKVTKRKAPAPEAQVRGATAAISANASDRTLEALEKEADRTGDRTKVVAYKRQMKRQRAA